MSSTPRFRILSIALAVAIFGVPVEMQSNQYYVRAAATGSNNGSDWANAYTALPATLQRGASYYIADGSYGEYAFDDLESASTRIFIRKATASDHGTNTGWQSDYGDGQASFARWDFETGYWEVDGNSSSWSYGFLVSGNCSPARECIDIGDGTSPILRNISLIGISTNPGGQCGVRGIKIDGTDALLLQNVESWNTDNDAISMGNGTNTTFDRLSLHTRNSAGCGTHGDAMELWGGGHNTLRYSRVEWNGQQVFWGGNFTHGRWDIYGNVFSGGATAGQGLKAQSGNPTIGPLYAYNNTFSQLNVSVNLGSNTTGVLRNNIFHQTTNPGFGGAAHDYNWFENGLSVSGEQNAVQGSDPFVNDSAGDYRLATSLGPGVALPFPYDADPQGHTRGADGFWDIGAYELSTSGQGGSPAPSPPSGLRVVSGTE